MNRTTATHDELQAVIGRALVDPSFCTGLLNGHRAECLAEFDLSDEQARAARAIRASDLTTFAAELDSWISRNTAERIARSLTPFTRAEMPTVAAAA
jgi:hypothetical protein